MLVCRKDLPFDAKAFLAAPRPGKTDLTFRANAEIYAQGDPADSVYFLVSGRAKLTVTMPNGKEAVLAIIGANDFFGEAFLAGSTHRKVSVAAIGETTAIRLEASAMRRALREEPRFAEFFIGYQINRKIGTQFDLVDQLVHSSEQRLARALLQITDLGEGEEPRTVCVKISQDTLADMVGTTRSRISFFMNKFRRAGFIEYKPHLRVHRTLLSTVLGDR